MIINISDTSFHNKIMSRYQRGKRSLFPSMFFLKCARGYLSRIIDIHVRLNFQIHNKYMDLSSVSLQKFHEMKVIFSELAPVKHAPWGILYRMNGTLTHSRIHKLISGFHEINEISVNATNAIFKTPIFSIVNYRSKKIVSFRKENAVYEKSIFNSPMIINQISNFQTIDNVISARTMNDHVLNYYITANNTILQRTVYSQIVNHTKTTNKDFFSSDSAINNIFSNYVQTMSNTPSRKVSGRTFYHPMMPTTNNYSTQTKPVNYWGSNYLQKVDNGTGDIHTPNGGNSFILKLNKNVFNTIFQEHTNFWKVIIKTNQKLSKNNNKSTVRSVQINDIHTRIDSPGRSIYLDFAASLEPNVQKGINGSYDYMASPDIVFKKPFSGSKITDENKLNDEKTISAKIKSEKQVKNVPPQILQGEISSIANKVYKLLERRLSIEKEKRGVHIIG
jgi:hypothetical protein